MFLELFGVFLLSLFGTAGLNILFRFLGKKGYLGNLYQNIRGGTPRSIGLIPFLLLSLFLLPGFNNLVLIIGIFAFIDDIIGRKSIGNLPIEWGQLSRGIGMLCVIGVGYPLMGISSILVALLIQPVNISDMQPGTTSSIVIIMSIFSIIATIILGVAPISEIPAFYSALLLLVVCIGYAPLDYAGKIMLGEVGNHAFAVALGICFYIIGGFWWTFVLLIVTSFLIAFVRRGNLRRFFITKLHILNPAPGDYLMDVLTGGGLGDILRRIILGNHQFVIKNNFLIFLGFRRLLYNPYAPNNKQFVSNQVKVDRSNLKKFLD